MNGGFMSAETTSASGAEDARPWGAVAEERGSLGTLSWPRAAKIAGLAGAVAALAAMSIAAGHVAQVPGPPGQARTTSVVSPGHLLSGRSSGTGITAPNRNCHGYGEGTHPF
jgi:hypothetical protein